MGKPAARSGDQHVCPMVTPGTPPVPHVGGPINPPGVPTVLIGGAPAAVQGDICVCTGPPDTILKGSTGVFIGGRPAARQGDPTAHGGQITGGCLTVLIGETGIVDPPPPPPKLTETVDCRVSGVRLNKVAGWAPSADKHENPLEIEVATWIGTPSYEVVSGEDTEISELELKLEGLVSRCHQHSNKVLSIQQVEGEDDWIENNRISQKIKYPYQYSIIGGFFNSRPLVRTIRVQTCQTGSRQLSVLVYPNTKIKFDFQFSLLWADYASNKAPAVKTSLGFDVSWNNKRGSITGVYNIDRTKRNYGDWDLIFAGAWGKQKAMASLRPLRRLYQFVSAVIKGQEKLKSLLNKAVNFEKKKKRKAKKSGLLVKFNFSGEWNSVEDKTTFRVGRRKITKADLLVEPKFEWDISDFLLSKIPVGWAFSATRYLARAFDLGDFYAVLSIKGKLLISGYFQERINYFDGSFLDIGANFGKQVLFVGIEIKVRGYIRMSTYTVAAEVGVRNSGLQATLDTDKDPAEVTVKFTGVEVYGLVTFEDADVAEMRSTPKHKEEHSDGTEIRPKSKSSANPTLIKISGSTLYQTTLGK